MRILVVSFYYSPEVGAAPSRITTMAQNLHQFGAEVDVLTCLPNYPKGRIFEGYRKRYSKHEVIDGINIFRYWTYATAVRSKGKRLLAMFSFALTLWSFAWRIRRIRKYDFVIIQSPPLPVATSASILFGFLFRRKILLNVSDLWPESAVRIGAVKEGSLPWKILATMERFVYKKATCIQGQSQSILQHIKGFAPEKPQFLYRNLKNFSPIAKKTAPISDNYSLHIVYAGLLGEAQDIAGIINAINFKELGAELHIWGGGTQKSQVEECAKAERGVFYHGVTSKEEVEAILPKFDAGIVPLAKDIPGAVPSKIFDLMAAGVPIIYCGEGEARQIIEDYKLGYVSPPGNYQTLAKNIQKMVSLSPEERDIIHKNTRDAAANDFSQERQAQKHFTFLNTHSREKL